MHRSPPGWLAVAATGLLAMWLFGNLYEQIVVIPPLVASPEASALPGEFALGSPVYYYLPWTPLGIIALLTLRLGYAKALPANASGALTGALTATGLGLAAKLVLITTINPQLRDPAATMESVHTHAVIWLGLNGLAIIAVATAVVLTVRSTSSTKVMGL